MGKLRKIGKKIGRGMKSIGRKLKSGFGKIAGAFGKLGPLGTIALSFILPGIGNFLTGMAGTGGVSGFIGTVAQGIQTAAGAVKNGVGKVFNRVTDAIEGGMNAVSKPFLQKAGDETARGMGSAFRDFVSDATGGFVDRSTVGLRDEMGIKLTDSNPFTKDGPLSKEDFTKKDLSDLQDKNKFSRDIDKFRKTQGKKGVEFDTLESPTDTGVEFYKKEQRMEDGTFKGDPIKTISDRSRIPKEIVAPKESVFASGDYDSFKARVKGSSEFGTFKKLSPIVAVGSDMNATKDMEEMQAEQARAAQAAYFSDTAMATLGGISNPDSNVSYFDFNNNAPSEQQLFNLQNSYSGILGTA